MSFVALRGTPAELVFAREASCVDPNHINCRGQPPENNPGGGVGRKERQSQSLVLESHGASPSDWVTWQTGWCRQPIAAALSLSRSIV